MEAVVLVLKDGDCFFFGGGGGHVWILLGLKQFLTDCMVFTDLLKFLIFFCIHYYLHEV